MRLDHPPLLTGDIFTEDPITTYIYYKLDKEVNAMRQRPHPYEFAALRHLVISPLVARCDSMTWEGDGTEPLQGGKRIL